MASRQPKPESIKEAAVGVRGYRIRNPARAEKRRREILAGAARAFARAGFDATNMDQIARECGLAKGHIYHYFRSKEEIFTEIRVDAVNRASERLSAVTPLIQTDPEQALRKAIASVVGRIFNEEERYEPVLLDPASLSPENRNRIRTAGRCYEQTFTDIVRAGIDRRIFVAGDPKLMTFVILRAAFTVANWYRAGGRWKPQFIIEQVTDQLMRSVLCCDRSRPGPGRKAARA